MCCCQPKPTGQSQPQPPAARLAETLHTHFTCCCLQAPLASTAATAIQVTMVQRQSLTPMSWSRSATSAPACLASLALPAPSLMVCTTCSCLCTHLNPFPCWLPILCHGRCSCPWPAGGATSINHCQCPAGTDSILNAATKTCDCIANTYNDADVCKKCPGTPQGTSLQGSTSVTQCSCADPLEWLYAGNCVACDNGQVLHGKCVCKQDFFLKDGVCTKCAGDGTTSGSTNGVIGELRRSICAAAVGAAAAGWRCMLRHIFGLVATLRSCKPCLPRYTGTASGWHCCWLLCVVQVPPAPMRASAL